MKKTIVVFFAAFLVALGFTFSANKLGKNTKVAAEGETYEAPVVVTPSDLNKGNGDSAVNNFGRMFAISGHRTWKLKDSVVLPANNSIEFKALLDFSTWRQTTHSAENKFQVSFSEDQYFGELLIRENKCFVYKDSGAQEIPFDFLDGKLHLIQYGRKAELVGGTPTGSYLCYLLIDGVEKYSTLRTGLVDALASKGGIGSRYISNCQDSYISFFDPDYEAPTFEKPNEFTIKDLKVGGSYLTSPWTPLQSAGNVDADWNKDFASDSAVFHFVMNLANSGQLAQIGFKGWNNRILVWGEDNGTIIYQEDSTLIHNGYRPATGVDLEMEYGCLKITNGENSGKYYLYLKENGVLMVELVSTKGLNADSSHGVMFFNVKSEGLLTLKDVEITKNVTFKVGEASQTIEVPYRSLLEIPTNINSLVPSGKRIYGWTIDGTDTEYNFEEKVLSDISLVATVDDIKWIVKFGDTQSLLIDGTTIVAPETNPTKASDATNHYTFECWEDAEHNPFVEGTTASQDITYTAKFTETAHTYSEWTVKEEESCTEDGLEHRTCSCGYEDTRVINKHHDLTLVGANAETCTTDGNVLHYHCQECEKNFADEAGLEELETVVIAKHHTLTLVAAKAENCTTDGNVLHYHCSVCEKNFADEAGLEELETVVVAKHHELVFHEAKEESCTADGNVQYYECSECHKFFKDQAGLEELETVVIAKHHDLAKVEAVEATCTEEGNIEYYHCANCGKNYDADGKLVSKITIPEKGHTYGENGKCTVCGAQDPYYVAPLAKTGCSGSLIGLAIMPVILVGATLVLRKKEK